MERPANDRLSSRSPPKRRTLIVGAAVCVMALIAVGVAVLFSRDPAGGAQSAGQAVHMYLEALARRCAGCVSDGKTTTRRTLAFSQMISCAVSCRRRRSRTSRSGRRLPLRVRVHKFGDKASEATLLVTPPKGADRG